MTEVALIPALFLLSGCAPALKSAIHLDAQFDAKTVDPIFVLPAVDSRIDKESPIDLETQVRHAGVEILRARGYRAELGASAADAGEIIDEDLRSPQPAWVKSLAGDGARWIMIVELIDVSSQLTFGSTGNAEVAGYLFDAEDGKLVWRDKGVGQAGQGGLLGMVVVAAMDDAALSAAMSNLLSSMPVRDTRPSGGERRMEMEAGRAPESTGAAK
jgi:hypothetical protein